MKKSFSAIAFKIMTDPYVGRLAFVRIYSGSVSSGSYIFNPRKRVRAYRRILRMHANHEKNFLMHAGISWPWWGQKDSWRYALFGRDAPVILENIKFPEPVIAVAIEPKTRADQDKMAISLQKLAEEDPTFNFNFDEETGQTIINGWVSFIEIIVDRLLREFHVGANVGRPRSPTKRRS